MPLGIRGRLRAGKLVLKFYIMLWNIASGPDIGFPGRMSTGLESGEPQNRSADADFEDLPARRPDLRTGNPIAQSRPSVTPRSLTICSPGKETKVYVVGGAGVAPGGNSHSSVTQ